MGFATISPVSSSRRRSTFSGRAARAKNASVVSLYWIGEPLYLCLSIFALLFSRSAALARVYRVSLHPFQKKQKNELLIHELFLIQCTCSLILSPTFGGEGCDLLRDVCTPAQRLCCVSWFVNHTYLRGKEKDDRSSVYSHCSAPCSRTPRCTSNTRLRSRHATTSG